MQQPSMTSFEAFAEQAAAKNWDAACKWVAAKRKAELDGVEKRVLAQQRAAAKKRALSIPNFQIQKMDLEILEIDNFLEDNYHFLENGPTKNLDKGIEIFSKFYLKFQCLGVYKPLYDALIERGLPGDAEKAHQVQQIYFSTITY